MVNQIEKDLGTEIRMPGTNFTITIIRIIRF